MKKALIVLNMLFALVTMFYVNADTNVFDGKMHDWKIVQSPVEKRPILDDWQSVDFTSSDEDEFFDARGDSPNVDVFFDAREDFEDSDVFFDARGDSQDVDVSFDSRSYDDWEIIDTLIYSGPSEKRNRKEYDRFTTVNVPSLTLEGGQGSTDTVFFYDVDGATSGLTATSEVHSGSCPTAIESIATGKQSLSFIQTLQESCSMAYDKVNRFKNPKEISRSSDIIPFYKNNEYMGFVRQVGDKLIVSFPGTRFGRWEGFADVIKDFNFFKNDGGYSSSLGFSSHAAFSKDIMEVFDAMIEVIKSKSGNANEIWFTGHSKGGGEAILAAYKFALYVKTKIGDDSVLSKFQEENRIRVFTFSTPSVVDEEGKKQLHDHIGTHNIICVHKKPDSVTKVTDYINFVPVGVRMKMEKPKIRNKWSYINGLFSSHFLGNFGVSDYKKVYDMARYVNAKYAPKPCSNYG